MNKMILLDRAETKLHDDHMLSPSNEVVKFKENTEECIHQLGFHIRDLYKEISSLQSQLNSIADGGKPQP